MKKLYIICVLTLFLCNTKGISQEYHAEWSHHIGTQNWDWVSKIACDSAGFIYLAGSEQCLDSSRVNAKVSVGSNIAFITKLDSAGNILWKKQFNSSGNSSILAMEVKDQYVFIAGTYNHDISFDSSKLVSYSFSSLFVASLDLNGNLNWMISPGGKAIFSPNIGLCCLEEGGLYVGTTFRKKFSEGRFQFQVKGESDIAFIKLNEQGLVVHCEALQGEGEEKITSLITDQNNLYFTGSFSKNIQFNDSIYSSAGKSDIMIGCLSFDLRQKWVKTFGGYLNESAKGGAISKNGALIIYGLFESPFVFGNNTLSPVGSMDGFLLKLDTAGIPGWSGCIGGKGIEKIYDAVLTVNNTIVITGSYTQNLILPFNPGTTSEQNFESISGFNNSFISIYGTEGKLIKIFNLPGGSETYCNSLLVDSAMSIICAGNFRKDIMLQKAEGSRSEIKKASKGNQDIFISKYVDYCSGISLELGPDTSVCEGSSMVLESPDAYSTYLWIPSNTTERNLTITEEGRVWLEVTDQFGCKAKDSLFVGLNKLPGVWAGSDTCLINTVVYDTRTSVISNCQNSFWTTSGNGKFDSPDSVSTKYTFSSNDLKNETVTLKLTGQNQCGSIWDEINITLKAENSILIMPNPATTNVIVSISDAEISVKSIEILNQEGTLLILKTGGIGSLTQIDISGLSPGHYLIRCTTSNGVLKRAFTKI